MTTTPPDVYTRDELAAKLAVSGRTVSRLDGERRIPGRIALSRRLVRWDRRAVDRWLQSLQGEKS